MHVLKLFHLFLGTPNIEIIKSPLPQMRTLLHHRKSQPHLIRRAFPSTFTPQPARHTLFQRLNYLRRISFLRFANQQMHMFRHHYKTNQRKPVPFPHISQHLHKQIPSADSTEQLLSPITAKRNEVQMPVPVDPHQFIPHVLRTEEPHPYEPKGAPPTPNPRSLLGDLLQWYDASVRGVAGKKNRNRGLRVRHPL